MLYDVILADPPWKYRHNLKDKPAMGGYCYSAMEDEELLQLPVSTIAAADSLLFLWTTVPQLPLALRVMEAWGFRYKTTAFVWVKLNKGGKVRRLDKRDILLANGVYSGLGSYTNGNTEFCLLGRRGKLKRYDTSVKQVLFAPLQAHSQKPEEIYHRIYRLCGPNTRKLELFARRHNYHVFGFEQTGLEFDGVCVKEFIHGKQEGHSELYPDKT